MVRDVFRVKAELTIGPVVHDSAFRGLAHQGHFSPLSHSIQGSSHVPATIQLPSASGQNGGIHSHEHLTWLNMPLAHSNKSQRNSSPLTGAIVTATITKTVIRWIIFILLEFHFRSYVLREGRDGSVGQHHREHLYLSLLSGLVGLQSVIIPLHDCMFGRTRTDGISWAFSAQGTFRRRNPSGWLPKFPQTII